MQNNFAGRNKSMHNDFIGPTDKSFLSRVIVKKPSYFVYVPTRLHHHHHSCRDNHRRERQARERFEGRALSFEHLQGGKVDVNFSFLHSMSD